eukprot:g1211.t1
MIVRANTVGEKNDLYSCGGIFDILRGGIVYDDMKGIHHSAMLYIRSVFGGHKIYAIFRSLREALETTGHTYTPSRRRHGIDKEKTDVDGDEEKCGCDGDSVSRGPPLPRRPPITYTKLETIPSQKPAAHGAAVSSKISAMTRPRRSPPSSSSSKVDKGRLTCRSDDLPSALFDEDFIGDLDRQSKATTPKGTATGGFRAFLDELKSGHYTDYGTC